MKKKEIFIWFILAFLIGVSSTYASVKLNTRFADPVVVMEDKEEQGGPPPEIDPDVILIEEEKVDPNAGIKKYVVRKGANFPGTYAKSFIVADLDSGDVIASKEKDLVLPIASITKLMTGVVAEETLSRNDIITISRSAVDTYGRQGRLSVGEKYTAQEMFYPLLLESSNDAAEAIAEHKGREDFITDMNSKAQSIGLVFTNFDDPSGLSSENVSTVSELFRLTKYIYKFRNYIFDITRLKEYSSSGKTWYSNSRFRNDDNYLGGKNGYTDQAGKTQVAIFQLPLEGENGFRNIVIITLNSEDTTRDTRAIIKFLNEFVYYE